MYARAIYFLYFIDVSVTFYFRTMKLALFIYVRATIDDDSDTRLCPLFIYHRKYFILKPACSKSKNKPFRYLI